MFSFISKVKRALQGAEKAIETRNKIAKALKLEESKLLKLIADRVDADRALIAAETAAALGEQADVTGAQRRVENALAVIQKQAAILSGLRLRLAGLSGELELQTRGVKAVLPEHIDALKINFLDEWRKGVEVFGALLGRRRALEALVGLLDLPETQPSACDLGDVAAPWQAVEALTAAFEEVAGWSRAAVAPAVDAMMPGGARPFDRHAVYALTRDCDNLPVGTAVMESSFVPGMLQHLVNIQYAEPLVSQEWAASLQAGQMAANVIGREAQADAAARSEAEIVAHESKLEKVPAPQPSEEDLRLKELFENRRQAYTEPDHVSLY